jgi:allantoate deiminase
MSVRARQVVDWCRKLATFTERPGRVTRTFLSPPMHDVHRALGDWMRGFGMQVSIDAVGNLRGVLPGDEPRILIGSHLDTVPDAGAFDGILGVVVGIALAEIASSHGRRPTIEVAGFSEEEGVRYGLPFIGSRALVGTLDDETIAMIEPALREFGLDPARIPEARFASGTTRYLEFHIEQGPVLESLELPLGAVDAIAGQTRGTVRFEGRANHAGTTPMSLRRDALVEAAKWILKVDAIAHAYLDLVATVGSIEVQPNAGNVIPGRVTASLDVRHRDDEVRQAAINRLTAGLSWTPRLEQPAVPLIPVPFELPHLTSGAGHDAMVIAPHIPSSMIFLRSPGGISHSPLESVLEEDVEAALALGERLLQLT